MPSRADVVMGRWWDRVWLEIKRDAKFTRRHEMLGVRFVAQCHAKPLFSGGKGMQRVAEVNIALRFAPIEFRQDCAP